MLLQPGRCKEADPTSTEGLTVFGSLQRSSMPRKSLTRQTDISFESFTMQTPKTYCCSTQPPRATQPFALWISRVLWDSVGCQWSGFSLLISLEGWCLSPKGFTVMGSHNLIFLVCALMLLQRKREILKFSGSCGTHCCRMSLKPGRLRKIAFM